MDTALALTASYWDDPIPDLRFPPHLLGNLAGAREAILRNERLQGHVVFATSGSSGAGPKLVCLEKRGILLSARWSNRHLGCDASDRWFLALPTFHVGGFGVMVRSWMAGGALGAFQGGWAPGSFVEQLRDANATVTSLVPTQVHDLVRSGCPCPSSLRLVVVGGARLDPGLRAAALALGWPVRESFGMTETAAMIASQQSDLDPVGWIPVIPDWEVACREGQLLVRGQPLLTTYLEQSAGPGWVTREPREAGGWFPTGDLGEIDSAGRLRVHGRAGRIVKILGELVDLDRLDLVLASVRPEGDAVLESIEDPRAGWKLVLVTEREGTEAERIRDAFNERVAPYERILTWRTVPRIAKSPLGKRLPQPGHEDQADSSA